jgi:DNA-directed RNA polymerase subunit M/transcription elongation factor TFIIS
MFEDLIKKSKDKNSKKIEIKKDRNIAARKKQCPKCKSSNVISTGFQSFPPYMNVEIMKCLQCNYGWHVLPIW